jgi:3'-phosphoadenosine 5'-phosphosulfate sulfotransferase
MKIIRDCFGRSVRMTDERIAHILQHLELVGMEEEISRVLAAPAEVRISRLDETVQLFYEYYARTRVGGKWLCVVVKYPPDDAFVVTAYLTDKLKAGETIWRQK